eukprot:8553283-Lingulodinium_polyedra.AAC.1
MARTICTVTNLRDNTLRGDRIAAHLNKHWPTLWSRTQRVATKCATPRIARAPRKGGLRCRAFRHLTATLRN